MRKQVMEGLKNQLSVSKIVIRYWGNMKGLCFFGCMFLDVKISFLFIIPTIL